MSKKAELPTRFECLKGPPPPPSRVQAAPSDRKGRPKHPLRVAIESLDKNTYLFVEGPLASESPHYKAVMSLVSNMRRQLDTDIYFYQTVHRDLVVTTDMNPPPAPAVPETREAPQPGTPSVTVTEHKPYNPDEFTFFSS